MFSFNSLQTYAAKWSEAARESLSKSDVDAIARAEVVQSNYGLSVCFYLKGGGQRFIPLSTNSSLNLGDAVDPTKGQVVTLKREGDEDIYRWE